MYTYFERALIMNVTSTGGKIVEKIEVWVYNFQFHARLRLIKQLGGHIIEE